MDVRRRAECGVAMLWDGTPGKFGEADRLWPGRVSFQHPEGYPSGPAPGLYLEGQFEPVPIGWWLLGRGDSLVAMPPGKFEAEWEMVPAMGPGLPSWREELAVTVALGEGLAACREVREGRAGNVTPGFLRRTERLESVLRVALSPDGGLIERTMADEEERRARRKAQDESCGEVRP